jgi:DNA/RNA-binding domain of Phe-tRNA-synthetase-like protein
VAFEVLIDEAVRLAYPDYVGLVLVAEGVRNGPTDANTDAVLADAEAALRASGLERAADHPHIAAWRAAFSSFGAKPSRYPSSAEALMARVLKGQPLPRVNALVDLYNAVSVRHALPLGGEDADRLDGALRLTMCWNWRQGRRTQLTESTTRAFFVFDRLDGLPLEDLHRAVDELSALLLERWPAAAIAQARS